MGLFSVIHNKLNKSTDNKINSLQVKLISNLNTLQDSNLIGTKKLIVIITLN